MNNPRSKQNISGLLALLLFAVFAVCILSVLLSGTEIYQRLAQRNDEAYNQRTTVQYLYTKIRQTDAAGAVTVEDFCGTEALVLSETWDGAVYETRVYCSDGKLRELFSPAEAEILPAYGEVLLPLEDLDLTLEGDLLQVTLQEPGQAPASFSVSLRSMEGTL